MKKTKVLEFSRNINISLGEEKLKQLKETAERKGDCQKVVPCKQCCSIK